MPHQLEHLIELRHSALDPVRGIHSSVVSCLDVGLHQHLEVGHGDGD